MHQFAVGKAAQARGGADALDPQTAILALAVAAVAIRVTVGAIGGLLHGLVELALGEEKTLGAARVFFAARAALGAAFDSSHEASAPVWRAREKPWGAGGGRARRERRAAGGARNFHAQHFMHKC